MLVALCAFPACAASLDEGRACGGVASGAVCDDGRTCVVGRCRPVDTLPAPLDTVRMVMEPVALGVVARHGAVGGTSLPATVALGSGASGTVTLLFRFDAALREDAEVVSAVLVLEALRGSPAAEAPTSFETARIVEPWDPEFVSAGRTPAYTLPAAAGSWNLRPGVPVRIDVTSIVRRWTRRDPRDHGLALLARGDDVTGAVIPTGSSLGHGPRLEVYVK